MIAADYLLAWLLPLVAGAAACRLVQGRASWPGAKLAAAGTGWIVGLLLAAVLAAWHGRVSTPGAFASAWPWLAVIAAALWLLAAWRARAGAVPRSAPARATSTPLARVAWWLLLAVIVGRLMLLGAEAGLRPVFPWDAWSAWAVKPKTWMLLGHAEPFVGLPTWLGDPDAAVHTTMTWNYPELLAWIQIWFASAAGGWNEPLVDLAWCGAFAAFALAAYGYWRGIGVRPLPAIALVYAFVSLPLLDTHVALAGYADLWIAVILGLAALAWSRWLACREHGHWWLALALAACLPAIKLEGAVWLTLFAGVVVIERVPARWRIGVVALFVVALVGGLATGGFSVPLPGLGWVGLAWGRLTIPGMPPFDLTWHAVGEAMLASLYALPNWHLLWYALPLLVLWRWRVLRTDSTARMLGALVLVQCLMLFVLFFFTMAAAWAQDYTSANRLVLQIVPCVFAFAAALLREPQDGQGVRK